MKKEFKPQEWLNIDTSSNTMPCVSNQRTDAMSCTSKTPLGNWSKAEIDEVHLGVTDIEQPELSEVEMITQRIESSQTDITTNYADWRDIGFALADELGEAGRDYYHRISRFHPDYNTKDCNQQFDKCLKANGQGITIKTLFHLAKSEGINISFPKTKRNLSESSRPDSVLNANEEVIFNTPQIPSLIYEQLPDILKESTNLFQEGIEKDVFLIGALSVISACLPNIEGIYFDEPVSAHLYAFITAPAGSGKGKLKWAKYFGIKIHKTIVEESIQEKEEYDRQIEEYNNLNKKQRQAVEKPIEPKRKMFYIPANSSASAFIQALADNDFKGIIFETEADTLSGTLKQDWGNFTDVLRKAFHHESTNMFRRKDSEYIEIEDPHLAIALSGTPKQVHNMMPDAENGLFSRFLYYAFEDFSDFKNPFVSYSSVNYTEFFEAKAREIDDLYQMLKQNSSPIRFSFTNKQGERFTQQFNTLYNRNRMLLGNDFNANSRRLGLITFRIAMVLRSLRILEDGDTSTPLLCNEVDFQTAIEIAFTLEKHAIAVFQNLPNNNNLKGIKLKFYNALPHEFNRQEYLAVAKQLDIKDKTAEKYVTQFREAKLLSHEHNKYTKTNT
ncbi:DUF3987 domain-containing protein [Marinifilum sp. RC60d5]|uniref:DUF3987 domain-containing protein n=1 Tax=Marinifilum sp. RC60d5 TaxID=3458414 RepID=UPI0040363BDA